MPLRLASFFLEGIEKVRAYCLYFGKGYTIFITCFVKDETPAGPEGEPNEPAPQEETPDTEEPTTPDESGPSPPDQEGPGQVEPNEEWNKPQRVPDDEPIVFEDSKQCREVMVSSGPTNKIRLRLRKYFDVYHIINFKKILL